MYNQLIKRDIIVCLMFSQYKKGRKLINRPTWYGNLHENNYEELLSILTGGSNPFVIMDIADGIFKKYCKCIMNEVPKYVVKSAYSSGSNVLFPGVTNSPSIKNNPEIVKYIVNKHTIDKQKYDSFFVHENIDQYIAIAFKKEFVNYFNSLEIVDVNTFYYFLENSIFDRIF